MVPSESVLPEPSKVTVSGALPVAGVGDDVSTAVGPVAAGDNPGKRISPAAAAASNASDAFRRGKRPRELPLRPLKLSPF